jgi:tyrosyl-tRNA synthetase
MDTNTQARDQIPGDVMREAEELARAAEILPGGVLSLAQRIHQARSEGRVLRVKLGVDPTSSFLHLGHAVVLRKLRRFQDFGHQAVLIIGGFTARIGDPTGRQSARPSLSAEDVAANARTYLDQVGCIIDVEKAEVVNNADWLGALTLEQVIALESRVTANQMLAKEGFAERLEANQPLGLHELKYPLLQGFDSVQVRADIELGGTDQRFNLLMGRQLQPAFGQQPQLTLMLPLLEGTDGVRKMSKSFGNAIGIADGAEDMFAKCMRLSDALIVKFFELATTASAEAIAKEVKFLSGGGNPKDAKERLGHRVVQEFHGKTAADAAVDQWQRLHTRREIPEDMPSLAISIARPMVDILVEAGLAASKNKARQLAAQGGVRLDGEKVTDVTMVIEPTSSGHVLSVGTRRFVRVVKSA